MSAPTASTVTGGRADAAAGHRPVEFDTLDAWELNPKVALRPEPFGALLYHLSLIHI